MTELQIDTTGQAANTERNARTARGRKTRQAERNAAPKTDLYTDVTAKIVRELEAGRFPWVQPRTARGEAATLSAGLPKNAATGASYSGINILLLWGAAFENGFATQVWVICICSDWTPELEAHS